MKLEQGLLRKTIITKFVIHFKTQLKLGFVFALDQKCDATVWPDSFIFKSYISEQNTILTESSFHPRIYLIAISKMSGELLNQKINP